MKFLLGVWSKTPWWLRIYSAIVVAPNQAVTAALFFWLVVPWVHSTIHATIMPLRDQRDVQIQNMLEVQEIHNKAVFQELQKLNQHQSIQYQAILDIANKN